MTARPFYPKVGDVATCSDCGERIEYRVIESGPLAGTHATWQHDAPSSINEAMPWNSSHDDED